MSNRKKTTPALAKDVLQVTTVGPDHQITVETISDADWQRTSFEADVIDAFRRGARTRENAKKAARMLEWSTSKFYRKLKAYEDAGHAMALFKVPTKRAWHSKLDPAVEEIVEGELKKFLKQRRYRGQQVTVYIDNVQKACAKAGIEPPSDRTIRRRWESLDVRVRYAHKNGAQAAADKYDRDKGSTPLCTYPLERVQIDHTYSDVHLISEELWISLGRPTFTMVVDEFSRLPLGIHVTFGYPSVEELAEAMAIACLPKDGWLAAKGIEGIDWPWFGVPSAIFVDRGVDFTSKSFHRGCGKWRIDLSHRSQPHHGGIVERMIGTAMTQTRKLPGNTIFSSTRREKDRIDPTETASLTLDEYLEAMVRYFVGEYPYRIHPALGMTPAEKWNLGVAQYGDPRRVDDPQAFYLDFLKTEKRKLEKYGFRVSYLSYTARELQPLLNAAKGTMLNVKRDPADVSRAFVEDPRNGRYIELRDALTEDQAITVAEWERARADFKAKLRKRGRVTATGILGIIEKERAEAARHAKVVNPRSKLDRAKQRKIAQNAVKRERGRNRLPAPEQSPLPPVPVVRIDPASITILPSSGAVQ